MPTGKFLLSSLDLYSDFGEAMCSHEPERAIIWCKVCCQRFFARAVVEAETSPEVQALDCWGPRSPMLGDPAAEQLVALEQAMKPGVVDLEAPVHEPNDWKLPDRWPSGIAYVDNVQGGFTGLTLLTGPEGVGKSLIAHESAVMAACQGYAVFYCNAEMSIDESRARWDRFEAVYPLARGAKGNFWNASCPPGFDMSQLVSEIEDIAVQYTMNDPQAWPRRLLIVLDSINTMASLGGGSYLDKLHKLAMWAMQSRKISRGQINWLVVSETNKEGGAKGGSLNYLCDLYVALSRERDKPDLIDIHVKKARQGPSQAPTAHRLDWERQRFVVAEDGE